MEPLLERLSKSTHALTFFFAMFSIFFLSSTSWAQCLPDQRVGSQIQQLFDQHNWTQLVRLVKPLGSRSAQLNFEYGLALAHLKRWPEARAALLVGERQCPLEKRFPIELAGVAFERKRYPEAAGWLRRALKLDPKDAYANNFAGTVYFLMGNLEAALKYWNRIQKPYIAALHFDPNLRVQRLLLDRSFVFSPATVLKLPAYMATGARLQGLGIFPAYSIVLNARADGGFDADFHALERNGFGSSRVQALVSTFGGAVYETIYPSYFNIGKSAINFESLLRWDSQKRRAWFSLSAPVRDLPQQRWQLSADVRDENWVIRRSSTGPAPPLGSLNLQWQTVTGSVGLNPRRTAAMVDWGRAITPKLSQCGLWIGVDSAISIRRLRAEVSGVDRLQTV